MGSTTDDKFVGKTLPGGYHILDLISVGGMGRVYRAEQSALGRTVAVKIIHPHLAKNHELAEMFMDEARLASCVSVRGASSMTASPPLLHPTRATAVPKM